MRRLCPDLRPTAFLALLAGLYGLSAATADIKPHAGMLRYPDVSRTHIVFLYANNLWLVPRTGGVATLLASPPGAAAFPRFSPDDRLIAFVANYDGNDDLYTLPVTGGIPARVTHHPAAEMLCDWTPDGRLLFSARGYFDLQRQTHLLTVPATGGLPEKLPVPYGAVAAISPDGTWLAYTPHTTDHRTWKRYVGGMATDIWLFNLRTYAARRITDWPGTDSQPMWHGQMIYYMSDAGPEHRLNIWFYDPQTGRRSQVTHFTDFDVKWPAIGPGPSGGGEIVFQCGPDLYLLDLATWQALGSTGDAQPDAALRRVEVIVPGDRPAIRPQRVEAARNIFNWEISATGKRAVFEARGDIWTVPARIGPPRNLTHTSGVAERDPAWSPDGRWIAYLSDQTGEYELYLHPSDGQGPVRQLTGLPPSTSPATASTEPIDPHDEPPHVFRYRPTWSPDSKHIAFVDKRGAVYITTLATGRTRFVDRDEWGELPELAWSPDSAWLAYTRTTDNLQTAIWFYHLPTGNRQQVTSGTFRDHAPAFDRAGKFFYFASNRRFRDPIYEDVGSTFVYANTDILLVVPLKPDTLVPWAPRSDEETWQEPAGGSREEDEDRPKDEQNDGSDDADTKDDQGDPKPGNTSASGRAAPAVPRMSGLCATLSAAPSAHVDTSEHSDAATNDRKPAHQRRKEAETKPVEIDFSGFEPRAVPLPVKPGAFHGLRVTADGNLVYVRRPPPGGDGEPTIQIFDPDAAAGDSGPAEKEEEDDDSGTRSPVWGGWDGRAPGTSGVRPGPAAGRLSTGDRSKAEKTVVLGADDFRLSADGRKLLVHKSGTYAIVDARPDQSLDHPLALDGLVTEIRPREEWNQLFVEAWRIERDFFYAPNMHGVNWTAQRDHYAKMLEDCVSRADVGFVIRELISELNVGHAYYWGDELPTAPRVDVGLLGADFELRDGVYRFRKLYAGGPWDVEQRGPLSTPCRPVETRRSADQPVTSSASAPASQPETAPEKDTEKGFRIQEGDCLLAVNGVPLDATKDPWAAFQGLAGKVVTLTVSRVPPASGPGPAAGATTAAAMPDDARPREVAVRLLTPEEEAALRYRAWVERNRTYVEQRSEGRVGYIHVPDTGINGQNELFRQFYGQRHKAALIIDERWNGGGQLPHRFVELLNRPLTNFWATRDGRPYPSPADAHFGPKCMLINGLAGSGGDMFPFLFRHARLGKLIGTRTWGGLVGISGNPRLIDGSVVTAPTFAFYETDGTWGIEGHGVEPDIEVIDDPALMIDGRDPQLDRAIELMLEEIAQHPYHPVPYPPYPDRSGMGLKPEDK
jgi:tricorn protease